MAESAAKLAAAETRLLLDQPLAPGVELPDLVIGRVLLDQRGVACRQANGDSLSLKLRQIK